jgi:hypothetical protein
MNPDELAKLDSYLRQWTSRNSGWQDRSPEEIATAWAHDADFSTIKLAAWLRTSDGQLIQRVVEGALPFPYNYGADVLTQAVQIAARQRTTRQRLEALAVGGSLAVALVLAFRAP